MRPDIATTQGQRGCGRCPGAFTVEDGLVRAHATAETLWVNYNIWELELSLPADLFFRARREVLVNLTRIKEIRPYFKSGFLLIMADAAATEIAVSERQARSLRQRIPGLRSEEP